MYQLDEIQLDLVIYSIGLRLLLKLIRIILPAPFHKVLPCVNDTSATDNHSQPMATKSIYPSPTHINIIILSPSTKQIYNNLLSPTFSFHHSSNSSVNPAAKNIIPTIYISPNQQINKLVDSTITPASSTALSKQPMNGENFLIYLLKT